MPTQINGLPAHVLLIHVVIAAIPLAALMLVASATWPAARARLGFLTPVVALVALVMVPITTNAGEWLEHHLGFTNARIRKHTELGDQLLPWAIAVFVLAVVVYVLGRRFELRWRPVASEPENSVDGVDRGAGGTATMTRTAPRKQALPVWATAIVAVLSVAVAVGTVIQLYRIGDSGAQAVWHGVGSGGH